MKTNHPYILSAYRCHQPACYKTHGYDDDGYRRHWVAVKRCEHGKIEGHSVPDDPLNPYPGRLVKNWCPGAGLGGQP